MFSLLFVLLLSNVLAADLRVRLSTNRLLDSPIANIHLDFNERIDEPLSFTYGSCSSESPLEAHHTIAVSTGSAQDRLVWRIPNDVPQSGCLSAWDNRDELVGRSTPQVFRTKRGNLRRSTDFSIAMDNSSGIDAEGPWFDGVAKLKDNNMSAVDTNAAKSKSIAIVGAGMAGLMTWLSLNMVGMKNISIIEASQRLGGRVHTTYFGDPSERQYQDMYALDS